MKIEYAGKSLKQVATTNGTGYGDAGQKDSWASGKIMCAISPGSEAQFIVTGIDGLTRKYTIAITQPNVSTTPVLTKVSVERTSDNAATVKFTSSMAGNYFYKVVEKGAAAPTVDTTKGGTTAVKGENTITLTNLSAGARDIYIVVKSLSNVECDPFKIEIPAYGSTETPDEGDFTISVNAPPTGGTIASVRTQQGLKPVLTSEELLAHLPELNELCCPDTLALCSIDSTDLGPEHWLMMAKAVQENYALYDGFIICHGTDTLAYTASALSYLIQNSPKPIVITGAQKPIDLEITDAKTNLSDSFLFASCDKAHGVNIVFDGKVIAGTRGKKERTKSYNAFSSINFPYIATIQDNHIIFYLDDKDQVSADVTFYHKLDSKVTLLKLIPSMNGGILDYLFKHYDAVIIGHSQFEKIPMSIERQREQLEKQLDDIERGIDDVQASKGEQFTVKQLMKTRKAIKTKLEKLNDTKRKDTVIDFEQLGVDRLFIDESHFYKNLYLYTKMRNVGGIAQTEAQKSSDLFMKCRYLDEITGNRGTVFATGTPVSNSMVELYSVQRYLQYDTLAQNGLQHFDSWASTFGETVTALELAPEGTNYRAKTRFAKFYNLPELMQMFREVADIQTADMLKLPVPKVNYHNIKTKPSEIQTEMVASLAKRAEKVRARLVEPNIDNMLKITNDGRKLALDQRMIDPMLPDDPDSKVNACVDNVYRIWEEHADTKATQLVFCDLSTPKNDGTFNVYDDMREKLIARGIPAGQIRFIHEATTDAQKKELFGKVRSGEVRVLFGSTPKMGAGTNVQDRLIAIHNLDCPWRPSDLEQRQGRIERQGNMFPEVEVYRYVTEQTFDAYLYQLVESKQKFISQIMTSKSPVRSAEDVDEVALSFAEVKMLATGDARFKEKMDLDIQVSKLRVLKQSYLSEHYDLEDRVLKYYPQTIKEYEERIAGYENDAALAEQHKPQGEDKFCPMTLKGVTYTEKADAGEMLLAICKDYPMSAPTEIGSYRGFRMEIYYDTVNAHYCMNLCGKAKHKVDLGADALGNLTRIENELSKLPARLEAAKTKKAETIAQLETAKEEIKKPFAFEDELKEKTERLNALNIELNLNEKDTSVMDTEPEQTEEQPERKCASRER